MHAVARVELLRQQAQALVTRDGFVFADCSLRGMKPISKIPESIFFYAYQERG